MSKIRKCFKSRWDKGYLLELDFSQLEIFVLAYLSADKQLKADLLSGADLHAISAEMLFGKGFTPEQRKIAKQLSFQLQYGAGAKSMAEQNGIPLKTAQKFIDNYYARYKGVKTYHDSLIRKVKLGRTKSDKRTPTGKPAGVSVLETETGRRYTFVEQDAPDWTHEVTSFSPTQIKNYPVQGFATGDIVPLVLGKLFRELMELYPDGAVKMVCTVHDSVVFDCVDLTRARRWAKRAKEVMQGAPRYLKEEFGIDFDLPLNAGCEIGENWHDMKALDI